MYLRLVTLRIFVDFSEKVLDISPRVVILMAEQLPLYPISEGLIHEA
jgi:hypothetical protein